MLHLQHGLVVNKLSIYRFHTYRWRILSANLMDQPITTQESRFWPFTVVKYAYKKRETVSPGLSSDDPLPWARVSEVMMGMLPNHYRKVRYLLTSIRSNLSLAAFTIRSEARIGHLSIDTASSCFWQLHYSAFVLLNTSLAFKNERSAENRYPVCFPRNWLTQQSLQPSRWSVAGLLNRHS